MKVYNPYLFIRGLEQGLAALLRQSSNTLESV